MCDKECDCKTCIMQRCDGFTCGDCYTDSIEQCRSGGIHKCRGYCPDRFIKRLWWCITGKIEWYQLIWRD